ncbi:MAG: AraC family transcriptional regulator [Tannerellaceae bacterium]|jgi:AraC-like DNA-binding protein|nr:AraC family transcriptional regulator [Tannerellaceae bacterium]
MENLFYLEEHTSCRKYKSDFRTGFKYSTIKAGTTLEKMDTSCNHILFLREGQMSVNCDEHARQVIKKDEFILIPKGAKLSCMSIRDSELLVMTFDVLQSVCDKSMLQSDQEQYEQMTYSFAPTPIRYPLTSFVDLLITYLKGGIDCEHLHEIKEKEFFLVLRRCYSKEEIMNLLYPIVGVSGFKGFVLQNYMDVDSITELAERSGMRRTLFDIRFREVFGLSARQWILRQTAKHVRYKAMDPDITIRDIMDEFKFNSATHFCRFCKQQFNCTPKELLRNAREE